MLLKLEERAAALQAKKFKKAKIKELELDDIKDEQFDEMRRPNTFYCTFEHTIAA